MGKVKDKYIKYEAAGDQRVGRTVAGLNVNSIEFGVSPPIYITLEAENGTVSEARQRQAALCRKADSQFWFGTVPQIWTGVVSRLVASLIYNRDKALHKLKDSCAVKMILATGVLPRNPHVVKVDVLYPNNNKGSDGVVLVDLTGLPNSTLIFAQIVTLQQTHASLVSKVDEQPALIKAAVKDLLDGRGIGGGTISMEDLNDSIRTQVEDSPILQQLKETIDGLQALGGTGASNANANANAETEEQQHQTNLYIWEAHPDKLEKRLPETFNLRMFQNCTPLVIWQAWHHGLYGQRWSWKYVTWADVPSHVWDVSEVQREKNISYEAAVAKRGRSDRQLFQSIRFLCQQFDDTVGVNTDTETPAPEALNDFYSSDAIQLLLPPNITKTGRKRRKNELSWKTVADALRKRLRDQQQAQT